MLFKNELQKEKEPISEFCLGCGMPLVSGKCSRKHPVKACKEPPREKIGRYPGKSNFYNYKDRNDFGEVGYAK